MKKSRTPQQHSDLLAGQIRETESRLAALQQEQKAIALQFEALAGTADMDPEEINALQARKQSALTQMDVLERRLGILQGEREKAEREEANARAAETAAELATLSQESQEEAKRFSEALDSLLVIIREAGNRRRQYEELLQEGFYLIDFHDLDQVSFPALPLLNKQDIGRLGKALSEANSVAVHSEWSRKRDALKQQRARERAKGQPKPEVKVSGPTRDDSMAAFKREYESQAREHDSLMPRFSVMEKLLNR